MDYYRKDPLPSAVDTAGCSSVLLRAGAPGMLCMLSATTDHPRSDPLLPRRSWGPGEIVGGVEGTRDCGSCCSAVTDVCCVLVTGFFESSGREHWGNTSPSPSWEDQPSSHREMPLLDRLPSLVPGTFWHI